jgi:hypothetical protein
MMAAKRDKSEVNYSPGKCCGGCTFYIEGVEEGESDGYDEAGTCKKVDGEIDEDMWCVLFKPKRLKTLAEGGG